MINATYHLRVLIWKMLGSLSNSWFGDKPESRIDFDGKSSRRWDALNKCDILPGNRTNIRKQRIKV